jgi:hypothetical protein
MIGNNKKNIAIILFSSIFIRTLFILFNQYDFYTTPQFNLSKQYFKEGYAIAAGFGYIRGEGPAKDDLNELYNRINKKNFRISTRTVEPISSEGKHYEMLHPPGMAILVATINRLFGIKADVPIQIFGMILDSLGAIILYFMVNTYFGRPLGLMVGLVYSVFPPLACYSTISRLPEGLLSIFIITFLACILKAIHSNRKYALLWYLSSGILLGIGCYLRPDYMLLPVFMAFALWLYTRRFVYSITTMISIQILVLIVLFPWAYRNHELNGRWIFTSTSVGATLITGLAEFNNPWGFGAYDEDRHEQAVAQGFESAWAPEADQYFRKLFIHSIRENPSGFIRSIILRIPMALFTPYDWGFDNPYRKKSFRVLRDEGKDRYIVFFKQTSYFLKAYWDRILMGLISFASLVGIFLFFLSPKNSNKILLFLMISPHVYSILTHMITHLEPRFLIPSAFCWLIGFAYFLYFISCLCLPKNAIFISKS